MRLEDLKRGMRCTCRNGIEFIISSTNNREIEYLDRKHGGADGVYNINGDLTHSFFEDLDIMKVEDITLDGYKTIWERKEEKFYLRIPNTETNDFDIYLNYDKANDTYFISDNEEDIFGNVQTQFTEEEIYTLPRQIFIQGLEKVKVK